MNAPQSTEKRSPQFDYWEEAVAQSLEEHGVTITSEQLAHVARDMEHAHDGYGMAFYTPAYPATSEADQLRAALKAEREKVFCRPCQGTGRLQYNSGVWAVDTQCDRCRGEGKRAP